MSLHEPNPNVTRSASTRRDRAVGRRLRRRASLVALGLLAALGGNAVAHAADLCLTLGGGGGLVLKRFKAPSKNKCEPIQGFASGGGYSSMSGSACTSVSGGVVTLNYVTHDLRPSSSYFETGTCQIAAALPSGGVCGGTYISTPGGQGRFYQSANATYCNVDNPN